MAPVLSGVLRELVAPAPLSDEALETRNRVTFRATRQILKLVRKARRSARPAQRPAGDAATFNLMLDKAEKTAHSTLVLANRKLVEDAFILARSLVSLTIDVSYLSTRDTDRFTSYRATGKVARRRMAQRAGFEPIDAERTDWKDATRRAKRWQAPGAILARAKKSGCADLYERAYRHGSSFEHSDAWSLMTYEPGQARPRLVLFHLAMLVTAYSLAKTYQAWEQFFGTSDATGKKIEAHFLQAFPKRNPSAAPISAPASR